MIKKFFTKIILKVIANCLAVVAVIFLLKGKITLTGWDAIISTILILTIANSFVKPLVRLAVLPLRIITLGLLNFVINIGLLIVGVIINTGIFYIVKHIYPDNITFEGLLVALKGGIILGIVNWIFGWFIK